MRAWTRNFIAGATQSFAIKPGSHRDLTPETIT
jgi:hypothetical protein